MSPQPPKIPFFCCWFLMAKVWEKKQKETCWHSAYETKYKAMCFELKYRHTHRQNCLRGMLYSQKGKLTRGWGATWFSSFRSNVVDFFFKVNLFCCCCFVLGFFLSFVLLRMEVLCNWILGKLDKHGLNIKRSCQFYEYSPPLLCWLSLLRLK